MQLIPLKDINERVVYDPVDFIAECEAAYDKQVKGAGDVIAAGLHTRPLLMMSGPSSSGKTTTALRITEYLESKGVKSHPISIDDYFFDVNEHSPRNEKGEYDFETPLCVDSALLRDHINRLYDGEEILVPRYDFVNQRRADEGVPLRIRPNEVVIFEGIHALNFAVTGDTTGKAIQLYTRVASQVVNADGAIFFEKSRVRLTRRVVRDLQFRGIDALGTLGMWENVRAGEHKYIVPYSDHADIEIDSFLPYEVGALRQMALEALENIPHDAPGFRYAKELREKLPLFAAVDRALIPERSILREFVGNQE